ncbi:D-glycero-beta-D-manno-heptose 1,7-bisphosphate 7-phosphatase [Pseudomonadota bacterium]
MRLIILDRDGVINEDSDEYVKSVDEWRPIPGSIDAISRLSKNDYRVVVATNQSGIARGYYSVETLMAMHDKMHQLVNDAGGAIEAVFFCPHGPDDACECRKPLPGMYVDIGKRLRVDLKDIPVIGDSLRDLQAAEKVEARPILVRTGKGERTLEKLGDGAKSMEVYKDLAAAVDALLIEDE